jgi:hypothetical protein
VKTKVLCDSVAGMNSVVNTTQEDTSGERDMPM